MTFSDLYFYLSNYNADKIIVSLVAFAIALVLRKTLLKKRLKRLQSLIPFISGILLHLILSALLKNDQTFAEIIKEGISSGSGGTVIYAAVFGFLSERYVDVPVDSFLFESVLSGYVEDEKLASVAEECADVLRQGKSVDEEFELLKNKIHTLTTATIGEAELLAKIMQNIILGAE